MRKNSPKRDYKNYLVDIADAVEKIEKFVEGMNWSIFREDEKTQDAVIRRFEIIGEAAKNIPQRIKGNYKGVPWKKVAGMRNKLAHEYFGIDKKVIWKTIKEDIPELRGKILKIIKDLKINKLNYL